METLQRKRRFRLPELSLQSSLSTLVIIWLLWAVTIIGFQTVIHSRLENAITWTGAENPDENQRGHVYLNDPFMNRQVAWDSEYYLSIAVSGYDDPLIAHVDLPNGVSLSTNYAFFPLYPVLMHFVAIPLRILNMNPIATATLAGVIISLLGTLGAMIALYDLTRDALQDSGGVRTAFYLLIFPTSFFLAQVYTEGLFVGLAFGSLALMRRKKLMWAAILAALAVWTRASGILLVVPLAMACIEGTNWREGLRGKVDRNTLITLLWVLVPIIAYGIWNYFFGVQFGTVQENFFARRVLDVGKSLIVWASALRSMAGPDPTHTIYYLLEFGSMLIVFLASVATIRLYPTLAVFSLLVLMLSILSAVPQSIDRYMLAAPSLFVCLAQLGRRQAFDRIWTVASVLLMGMLLMLFTFDLWVG